MAATEINKRMVESAIRVDLSNDNVIVELDGKKRTGLVKCERSDDDKGNASWIYYAEEDKVIITMQGIDSGHVTRHHSNSLTDDGLDDTWIRAIAALELDYTE